ncbi:MAG: cell wall hydrolase, partial [Erythrobacter sp.]|nr:cell wall hydrolase [Erythrobacter sp.]
MSRPRAAFAFVAPASRAGLFVLPKSWRKRLAVLFAAITVPAMAAPNLGGGGFGALPGPAVESTAALATRKAAAAALPFERPGMSFPGSAFYYMADPVGTALVALPTADPLSTGAAESGRELGEMIDVGAPAKPFYSPAVGLTHARAQECLAQAVWYEAASESEAGQRAVAQVVLNRVAHPSWPASVCGVVYQGSERSTGCQFTFTCDGSLARRPSGTGWARAQRIAADALN